MTRRRRLRAEPPLPTFFERVRSAAWVALVRALPTFAAGLLLYVGLDALALLDSNPWGRSVPGMLRGVLIFAAATALLSVVMAPREPQWRLVSLADRPARRIALGLAPDGQVTGVEASQGSAMTGSRIAAIPSVLRSTCRLGNATALLPLLTLS